MVILTTMAHQPLRKEKPPIPPKPTHLTSLEKHLPKPPDKFVDVNEVDNNLDVKNENNQYYGDDGYLSSYCGQNFCDDVSRKRVKNEEPENSQSVVRQRPLPLLPGEKGENVTGLPWFCSVDRRKAEDMVAKARNGTFLIRPSSKSQHSYALTLWFQDRAYNIPIRKRLDGKFALGTPKDLEQCFTSIEILVRNYQREQLVLFSNGVENGRTLLYPLSG